MHDEILNPAQSELLGTMSQFRREYYLVGGTAIALYMGHRRSVDFDLFKKGPLHPKKILDAIGRSPFAHQVTRRVEEQLNMIVNGVKLTFFQYPFKVEAKTDFGGVFRLPSLLDLAAMKAYALGRRSKWKDYVDLYFLLTSQFSISDVASKANSIFGQLFSEKMFRAQLAFFADIDYSEEVEYLVPSPPSNETIMADLTRLAAEGV